MLAETTVNDSDEEFVRLNYSVQAQIFQSLYAGEKQNKTSHTGESNRADNNLD